MNGAASRNPYDHPGFAPVREELAGAPVPVIGTLPPGLEGLFVRNGINALYPGSRPHMFDGEAMLHMVEIRDGEARYSNCIVRTPRTLYVEAIGRNPFPGVGDLAGGGKAALLRLILHRFKTRLGLIRDFAPIEAVAGGTSVLEFGGKLYCLQETGLPFALDVARDADGWTVLDGGGHLDTFGDTLASPFSAHPKLSADQSEVHSIGHDIVSGRTSHTVIRADGTSVTSALCEGKPPAFFVHDFIVTDRFIVFPDSSLRFDPGGLAKPGSSVAHFDAARPLRFGVVDREKSRAPVRWFETSAPGHIWHLANAWEVGEKILIHAPVFADYPATVPIHTPAEPHALLTRWELDLVTGTIPDERLLLDGAHERPSFDFRRAGQPSRFVWLLDEACGVMGKGIVKYDLVEERVCGSFDYGDLHGGEPLFVPRGPLGEEEDDGWLIDLLANGDRAELIILDAATMTEQCRLPLPRRVPFGVHGLWLDRTALATLQTVR